MQRSIIATYMEQSNTGLHLGFFALLGGGAFQYHTGLMKDGKVEWMGGGGKGANDSPWGK